MTENRPRDMTDEQRKQIAYEYLKAFDLGGVTPSGKPIIELFAPSAEVYFPKWGIARGVDQISGMLADIGAPIRKIVHHFSDINWIFTGGDVLVAEGTSHGEHQDGLWRADVPEWGAGRWCDVFEIRQFQIHRVFVYLDPDYAGRDTDRYPWIQR
ncbi:MAG: hypothetical protein LBO75_02875 [Bifidobacteriaceae bacterium]|jgi:hypothetical protein|nr:hypothetical protein [Bifidobacteriaceae bacterium]